MKKGLRPPAQALLDLVQRSNADLMKKGLRLFCHGKLDGSGSSNADLMKKGLRLETAFGFIGFLVQTRT